MASPVIVKLCLALVAVSLAFSDDSVSERKQLNPKNKGVIRLANFAVKEIGTSYKLDKVFQAAKSVCNLRFQ